MNRPIDRPVMVFCKVCGVELTDEFERERNICKGCLWEKEFSEDDEEVSEE